jgi:hypothetical protein
MLSGLNAIHPVVSSRLSASRGLVAQRADGNLRRVRAPGTNLESLPSLGEALVAQQPVPINSTLEYSENPYAKFSCPLMREKIYSYSELPGQTDGRNVSLSTSVFDG